jgi:thiamine-phosphate diphosphorylase
VGPARGLSAGVLPPLLVLTDRGQARDGLVATVAAAVEGGARAVVLREKDLPGDERARLAGALRALLDPVGGTLLVAGADVGGARAAGAGGVHLAAADPTPEDPGGLVVGRSCHDAGELRRAAAGGAHYATVSPVFASPSKPGYGPALGLGGLGALAAAAPIPVYALGGVSPASAGACLAAGAAGVAVMGAVMGADDPAAATAELLAALGAAAGCR